MEILRNQIALQKALHRWQQQGNAEQIALVPTMGCLHGGHLALITQAKQQATRVIVSIFVNPLQFSPGEDFAQYPRPLQRDLGILQQYDIDAVFLPQQKEFYPDPQRTRIHLLGLADKLEGKHRPLFLSGVATVVCKLLLLTAADQAFFGEKDYQQLLAIKAMVRDLSIRTDIVAVATVREEDGLALSSRNRYLSACGRQQAPLLYRSLRAIARAMQCGCPPLQAAEQEAHKLQQADFCIDYLGLYHGESLSALTALPKEPGTARILAAAKLEKVRLIDNIPWPFRDTVATIPPPAEGTMPPDADAGSSLGDPTIP